MGCLATGEIFENMLQLKRFGKYVVYIVSYICCTLPISPT